MSSQRKKSQEEDPLDLGDIGFSLETPSEDRVAEFIAKYKDTSLMNGDEVTIQKMIGEKPDGKILKAVLYRSSDKRILVKQLGYELFQFNTNIFGGIERKIEKISYDTVANIVTIVFEKPSTAGGKSAKRTKLESRTVEELKSLCAKKKIKYTGLRKAELIAALRK